MSYKLFTKINFYIILLTISINHNSYSYTARPYLQYSQEIDVQSNQQDPINKGNFDLMLPIYANETNLLFGEVTKSIYDKFNGQNHYNDQSYSIGLGFRRILDNGNMLGANTYLNNREIIRKDDFNQQSLGLEFINKTYEVRANLYRNIWSHNIVLSKIPLPELDLNEVSRFDAYERAEIEVGFKPNKNIGLYFEVSKNKVADNDNDDARFYAARLRLETQLQLTDNINFITNSSLSKTHNNNKHFTVNFALRIGLGGETVKEYYEADDNKETFEQLLFKQVKRKDIIQVKETNGFSKTLPAIFRQLQSNGFKASFMDNGDSGNETALVEFDQLALIGIDDTHDVQDIINNLPANTLIAFNALDDKTIFPTIFDALNAPNKKVTFYASDSINFKKGQYLVGDGYKFEVELAGQDEIVNKNFTFNKDKPTMELSVLMPSLAESDSPDAKAKPFIQLTANNGIVGMNIGLSTDKIGIQKDPLDRIKKNYFINGSDLDDTSNILIQDSVFNFNTRNTTGFEMKSSCESCGFDGGDFANNTIKFYNNSFNLNAEKTIAIETTNASIFALQNNIFNANSSNVDAINFDSSDANPSSSIITQITDSQYNNLFNNTANGNAGYLSFENLSDLSSYDLSGFSWNGNARDKLKFIYYGSADGFSLADEFNKPANKDSIMILAQKNFSGNTDDDGGTLESNNNLNRMLIFDSSDINTNPPTADFAENLILLSTNDKQKEIIINASYDSSIPTRLKWHDIGIRWDLKTNLDDDAYTNDKNEFNFNPNRATQASPQSMIKLNQGNIISGVDIVYLKRFKAASGSGESAVSCCERPDDCTIGDCNIQLLALNLEADTDYSPTGSYIIDAANSTSIQNSNIKIDIGNANINFMNIPQNNNNAFDVTYPMNP